MNWMTLEELALYLKVSRAYLYKAVQAGEIPAVKLGRNWRFDRERIDRWLLSHQETGSDEFPWQDCLDDFIRKLQSEFGARFSGLWVYGSWARGDAAPDSDVDLIIVLTEVDNFAADFEQITSLGYQATFGRDRAVVFSVTLVDQETFLTGMEPLLLNVRKEGRKAA